MEEHDGQHGASLPAAAWAHIAVTSAVALTLVAWAVVAYDGLGRPWWAAAALVAAAAGVAVAYQRLDRNGRVTTDLGEVAYLPMAALFSGPAAVLVTTVAVAAGELVEWRGRRKTLRPGARTVAAGKSLSVAAVQIVQTAAAAGVWALLDGVHWPFRLLAAGAVSTTVNALLMLTLIGIASGTGFRATAKVSVPHLGDTVPVEWAGATAVAAALTGDAPVTVVASVVMLWAYSESRAEAADREQDGQRLRALLDALSASHRFESPDAACAAVVDAVSQVVDGDVRLGHGPPDPEHGEVGVAVGDRPLWLCVRLPAVDTRTDEVKESLAALGEWAAVLIENADLHHRMRTMALTDPLTGLPNRRALGDRAEAAIEAARRADGRQVGMVFFDLDGFKPVNDTHGHDAGDQVLVEVAARMRNASRAGDVAARIGGDEFVLLLGEVTDRDEAQRVADRMVRRVFSARFEFDGGDAQIGTSMGVAMWPDDADDADGLIAVADQRMFDAKRGKGSAR